MLFMRGAYFAKGDPMFRVIGPLLVSTLLVAGAYGVGGATPFNNTWSGVTERYDEVVEGDALHTGASDAFAGAQTGLSISATYNNSPTAYLMVAASFAAG